MFYTTPEVKNPEQVHSEPGNSKLQCTSGPALILATTFMPHPGNIKVPVLEGFYKHQHQCILWALGPSSILVVFYCLLLSHRRYMVCGVRSLVNNNNNNNHHHGGPPVGVPHYLLWLWLIEVDQRVSTCYVRGLQPTIPTHTRPTIYIPFLHPHYPFCLDQCTKAPPISRFFASPIS